MCSTFYSLHLTELQLPTGTHETINFIFSAYAIKIYVFYMQKAEEINLQTSS